MALRLVANGIGYCLPGSNAPLLAKVSFDTAAKSRVGIIGKSGIGKSTLFRILAGLETEFEGDVVFPERSTNEVCIGFCYQDRRLMPWATLRQNVEYAVPANRPVETADHFIVRLGLANAANRKARDASGGEQARCAIARALVSAPDLLLLDEPMSGLDEPSRKRLIEDLLAVQREAGFLMLLITHDIAEVTALCESVHVLRGSPASITNTVHVDGAWAAGDCDRLNLLLGE